jgi:hypothetical protein
MISYKSIIFFFILFAIIIFGYFYYEIFVKFIPINRFISSFVILIGIAGLFFPQIIKKLRSGDDIEDIKEFIIERYKKK